MSELVLDSSAFMALLNLEPGAKSVARVIQQAAISSVNLCEIVTKLVEAGMNEDEIRETLDHYSIEIIPFDTEQAYDAGVLRASTRSFGLSLGDRCCLSLARSLNLPVLTADRVWSQLSIGVEINLVR